MIAERAWRSAADERPRELDDFDKLHAGPNRVLNWITFRKDELLRLTADERSSELFRRLSHNKGEGVVVGNPQRALALALRNGDLVAFGGDGDLSREFWARQGLQLPPMAECRFSLAGCAEGVSGSRPEPQDRAERFAARQPESDPGSGQKARRGPRRNCAEERNYQVVENSRGQNETGAEGTAEQSRPAGGVIRRNCVFGQVRSCALIRGSS